MTTNTPLTSTVARPPEPRRDLLSAGVAGVVAAGFAFNFGGKLAMMLADAADPSKHTWLAAKTLAYLAFDAPASGKIYLDWCLKQHPGFGLTWIAVTVASLGAGAAVGLYLAKPQDPSKHVRGYQLRDAAEAKKEARAEVADTGAKGVELIRGAGWHISQDRETKHFVVVGGTGSGKTVAVSHLLTQAVERSDRVLLIDYKGLTEKCPGNVVICDPTDARAVHWDIAADIRTVWDAEELWSRLIEISGKDPFWSNGSRAIGTGLTAKLIAEKPGKWGFQELAGLLSLPIAEYAEIMAAHYPQALAFVANHESNTTDSLIKNMSVVCKFIFQLAAAESANPHARKISFRAWAENPDHHDRTIILKINDAFSQFSASFNRAVLGVVGSRISSMPDVTPGQNRLWIIADEFPRLGKIDGWGALLAVGRSKSLRIVTVVQSVSQLRDVFGEHETDTWTSTVGTMILGRNQGATANWYCSLMGEREVWTPTTNVASSTTGTSTTNGYQRERLPVFLPAQCSTDLGVGFGGCKLILFGFKNVHLLTWPFLSKSENWSKQRQDFEPAPWTLSSFQPSASRSVADATGSSETISTTPDTPETTTNTSFAEFFNIEESATISEQIALPDSSTSDDPGLPESVDEGPGEEALKEASEHVASEALGHALGVSPELLSHGLEILGAMVGSTPTGDLPETVTVAKKQPARRKYTLRNRATEEETL